MSKLRGIVLLLVSISSLALAQPAAPVATAATGILNNGFTANWNTSAGANRYYLDVATDGSFLTKVPGYDSLNVGNVTSQAVTGLSAATTYYYRVFAGNDTSSSTASNTITALTVPGTPVATSGTSVTNSGFTANWGSVTGATSYKLDVATDSLFAAILPAYTNTDVGNFQSSAVTGLSAGTRYFYRVRAANASGSGLNSNTIAVLTLPAAPTANNASNWSQTGFRANWGSVQSAGAYLLDVATDIGFTSYVVGYQNLEVGTTFRDVTGLSSGATYYYRVKAKNSTGDSGFSNTITTVTVPGNPTAIAADSLSATGFRARWNTTPSADSYILDVATDIGFTSMVSGYPKSLIYATTYAVGSLSSGTTYYYRVRAVNNSGTSGNSNTITTITVPPAPVAISGDSVASTGFRARWNPATGAVSYTLDVATDAGFTSLVSGYPKSLIYATTYAVGGLTGNTPYYYRVRAVNASGTSANSNSMTVTTLPPAPTALSASAVLYDRLTANWTSVVGATSYRLDVATDTNFASILGPYNNLQVFATNQLVSGLSANTKYFYRVRAEAPGGTSSNSNVISQLTVPSAPVANSATTVRSSGFTANWGSVPGATGYRLDVSSQSNFSSYVSGYQNKAVASLSDFVSGLSANTLYYYRVRAENAGGTSDNSNTVTQLTAPPTPTATSATNVAINSFSANWGLVAGATSYKLDVSTDSTFATFFDGFNKLDVGLTNTYSVPGLAAGTRYFYRVRSASTGSGGMSDSSNTIGVSTVPNAPVIQAPSSITQTSFQANWSASIGATEYRLYVARDSLFTNPVAGYNPLALVGTNRVVSSLTAATRYFYRVRAYNGNLSAYSDSIGLTTLPNAPSAPTAKAGSNVSHNGFRANWDSSAGATEYRLDVATNVGFTNFVAGYNNKQVVGLTDSVSSTAALSPNTTYYYRVRAANIGGTSPSSSTITQLTAPDVPTANTPSVIASKSFTAEWTAETGATGYRLDVATNSGFTAFVTGYNNLAVTGTSRKVYNLTPGTIYYYRVRSVNAGGTSGNSNSVQVTTLGALSVTTSSPLPAGIARTSYSQNLGASGGLAPYTWTLLGGRLPSGINLGNDGLVSGIPTAADTVSFNVQVMDADSAVANKVFSLSINNPAPTISTITVQNAAIAGQMSRGQTYNVGVWGSNFLNGVTTVSFGPNTTTNSVVVDSLMHLTANVTVSTAAALGARNVSVTNPTPGGGTATLTNGVTINNLPSITSVDPASGLQNQTLDVTLTGTNFINGSSSVSVGGGPSGQTLISILNTVINSSTKITVSIRIEGTAQPGARFFQVNNPDPFGGSSNQITFSVGNNPKPVASSITPNQGARLQSNLEVTIRGNEFYQGMTSVQIPGVMVSAATVDSVSKLRVFLTIPATVPTGARKVYVINASPGGGTDSSLVLNVVNPVPVLTGIAPQNGNRLQTLDMTLIGNRFIQGVSHVRMGAGIKINTTTVDSASQMRVNLTIDSNATLGPRDVSVYNDPPGGDTATLAGAFTINNPGSGLVSLSPSAAFVGDTTFTLTVNGTSFVPGAVVRFDSTALATTFSTTSRLTAVVPTPLLDTAKVFGVTVLNPGAGVSNSLPFTVNHRVPTLTAIAPDSARRLDTVNVLLTGTNFIRGFSTLTITPVGEITVVGITYTSSTQMTAQLFVTAGASVGNKSIAVTNPAPGGGTSSTRTFRVWANPAPKLASIAPTAATRLQTLDVYLRGTKFIAGVTVPDFGPGTTLNNVRVDSATGMNATVTIAESAATGPRTVRVRNAAPGGGTDSLTNALTISNPSPVLLSVTPPNGEQLQVVNVSLRGRNFINGVTTFDFGSGITLGPLTFEADSLVKVDLTITSGAATGQRNVVVRNAAPGGGTFTLTNGFTVGFLPRPRITSITPASGERMKGTSVVIRGSNFLGGVTSVSLGSGITIGTVTVDSSSKLTVPIAIGATASSGDRDVIVTNAPPGGGSDTLKGGFSVLNPAPTFSSVTPSSAALGQTLSLIFRGSYFLPGVTQPKMGAEITVNNVQVDNDTQFTASVTILASAQPGARLISVENAGPGGGTSPSRTFTIDVPGAPLLAWPPDNAANQLPGTTLRWYSQLGAQGYRVQVCTTATFTPPFAMNDSTQAPGDTSIVTPSLSANQTTYYWRVQSNFGGGNYSSWSAPRKFSTLFYPASLTLTTTLDFPTRTNASEYQASEYRLIGLPGNSGLEVSGLMSGTNNVDWQAYWDNGAEFIKWESDPSNFKFNVGKGFWLIRKGQWKINNLSVTSATLDASGAVVVPLHSGWNIITNPFTIQVSWAQVKAANPSAGFQDPWTYGRTITGWSLATIVDPYVGYYLLNVNNVSSIRIPYPNAASAPKSAVAGGWSVSVRLTAGEFVDASLAFGVEPGSSAGEDPADLHKPRAIGPVPSIQFSRPEWNRQYPVFATDIRPEVKDLERWTFDVQVPGQQPASLSFAGVDGVPDGLDAYLIDVDRAKSVDLRKEATYAFTPTRPTATFNVLVGTSEAVLAELDKMLPKEFALGNNFPNPFNPSTTIPVAIPRASVITLTVYNLLGEAVRTIYSGPAEPGRQWYTWDGRNDAGRSVASGVYLYKLTAATGQTFARKMILVK